MEGVVWKPRFKPGDIRHQAHTRVVFRPPGPLAVGVPFADGRKPYRRWISVHKRRGRPSPLAAVLPHPARYARNIRQDVLGAGLRIVNKLSLLFQYLFQQAKAILRASRSSLFLFSQSCCCRELPLAFGQRRLGLRTSLRAMPHAERKQLAIGYRAQAHPFRSRRAFSAVQPYCPQRRKFLSPGIHRPSIMLRIQLPTPAAQKSSRASGSFFFLLSS